MDRASRAANRASKRDLTGKVKSAANVENAELKRDIAAAEAELASCQRGAAAAQAELTRVHRKMLREAVEGGLAAVVASFNEVEASLKEVDQDAEFPFPTTVLDEALCDAARLGYKREPYGSNHYSATLIVEKLIERGAAANALGCVPHSSWLATPLQIACGIDGWTIEAKLHEAAQQDEYVKSLVPATRAGPTALLRALLDLGASVNRAPPGTVTALHLCACSASLSLGEFEERIQLLLSRGADPRIAAGMYGCTPLHLLLEQGDAIADFGARGNPKESEHSRVLQLLLAHDASVNARTKTGRTPLMVCCSGNRYHTSMQCLLTLLTAGAAEVNACDDDGCTALLSATVNCHAPFVGCLLEHSANPNAVTTRHATHMRNGRLMDTEAGTTLVDAACECITSSKVLKLLLEAGAHISPRDRQHHMRPLAKVSARGYVQHAQLLIDAGDAVNEPMRSSLCAPLVVACEFGKHMVASLLIAAKADVNAAGTPTSDLEGWDFCTPLVAASCGGYDPICRGSERREAELATVNVLLGAGALVEGQDDNSLPLHAACEHGRLAVAKRLIEAGASLNRPRTECGAGGRGWTPLSIAAWSDHGKIVSALLAAGAEVDLLAARATDDMHGCEVATPLFFARKDGLTEIVRLLLDANADPQLGSSSVAVH